MNSVKEFNKSYWEQRASGYSQVNIEELQGVQRRNWKRFLHDEIMEHFEGKKPSDVRVLDIGAGPGFISIILAEQGFRVTAADGASSMLAEARRNAGDLADKINFTLADAENLDFEPGSYDVVLSRNLTWNLPNPDKAYNSWMKVLAPGGLILVFDANWYSYLVDEESLAGYEEDRKSVKEQGLEDYNIGENFDAMEEVARDLPMTERIRPAWDKRFLEGIGARRIRTVENVGRYLYSEKEKINYNSTPLFMIRAEKGA